MIIFNDLQPIVDLKYSFVGIQKCGSQINFHLPKGFDKNDFNTYDSKRDLFFLLYKVLRQFKTICIDRGYIKDDRDGAIQNGGSTQTIALPDATDDDELILYSKLDSISAIIDLYDELKILSLSHRLGISEKVDYSKIHKYLHACTYLSNGAAYVDVMTLPRQQVLYQASDIVGMYCYILSSIKQQLYEEIGSEVQTLADDFSHRYIGAEYSLFNEEYCTLTVDILKDCLEVIEHNTPLKDVDYWQFHDAIELFLYGELSNLPEGDIWGVSNFHSVWESMCLTHLIKTIDAERILHVDTTCLAMDVIARWKSKPKVIDINGVFTINGRRLVPDAVVIPNIFVGFPPTKSFIMCLDNWDDSKFKTTCIPELPYFDDFYDKGNGDKVKLGYIGQQASRVHTFQELVKTYGVRGDDVVISSKLPSNFYSYWNLEVLNRFNKETLVLMKKLNHIFYLAIKNHVYTKDAFGYFLYNTHYFGTTNCVNVSLLRDDGKKILEQFENFLRASIAQLQILDIKYYDTNEFLDKGFNVRYFKENSIRKQHVYEYLLHEHVKRIDGFNKAEVKSFFVFPHPKNSRLFQKKRSHFSGGLIRFVGMNFERVANHYFD
jgi:hypothetical protein